MKILTIRKSNHGGYTLNNPITEIQIQVSDEDFERVSKVKWQIVTRNRIVRNGDQQSLLKFLQYGRDFSTVTFLDGNRYNFQRTNLKYYP